MFYRFMAVCVCVSVAFGSIGERGGWLDRVVGHFKAQFLEDARTLPPVKFTAKIQEAPPGYVDSKEWDYDSVLRLLTLLSENKATRPVLRALRRSLVNSPGSRRYYMDKALSYKFFPKLPGIVDYYEDSDASREFTTPEIPSDYVDPFLKRNFTDDSVVVVSNPVESRLPSAYISVSMLKDILMARARAARIMPPTTRKPVTWKTKNCTTTSETTPSDDKKDDGKGNGTNEEEAEGGEGGGEGGGEEEEEG